MNRTTVVDVGQDFYEFLNGPAEIKTILLCNKVGGVANVEFKFKKSSSEATLLTEVKKSSVFKGGDLQFFLEPDDSISVKSDSSVQLLCSYSTTVTTSNFSGLFVRSSAKPVEGEINWGIARALLDSNLPGWGS